MTKNTMNSYYVYYHRCPETKDIVYVGVGTKDRAWVCRNTHRNAPHCEWLEKMFALGYTLQDIVVINKKNLSKKEALRLENEQIKSLRPVLNHLSNPDHWQKNLTFTKENSEIAKTLHEMGYGYKRIAFLIGANYGEKHMNVKRMINK